MAVTLSGFQTESIFDADVKALIDMARAAFRQLKNIWDFNHLSVNIKVSIFNTNVKTLQLYGAETCMKKCKKHYSKNTSIYELLFE
uniref:SJCHGC09821 protein n=1 Tax=Schistosoma japonicum TaxID=6182 RepID=Q5BQT0_SCHJA|nr:SJCHGC09821 protein [Schistosoma japonicum]